ncbi:MULTISPECIES: thioredoxin domain-containing protein [Halobacterium]|uniref:thioredoxin domain-containing protein n=1 Tax=Halobacterium TaxID=2239 RepID=UPI00073EBB9C|nr:MULTISPECIES: thioredoxin domain-containing protein [Halobacterium]MCG1003311.1 thioredoxin domain-containing protein [Halobacterium noricense]
MTDPTARNRLDETASPYLRQHADNPVNWQPWDEQAFEAARERDVPIFLSIGYSACHWCHVMEEESFSDPEVAEVLNEHFVPIKVDREERPDVDSLYMTVCQAVRGGGGWPLSAFLTPEKEPFYVGTYFPKHAKGNQPGFLPLTERVSEEWSENREELEERADQWMSTARGELESLPDPIDAVGESPLLPAADDLLRAFDHDHGGFGRAPKFPQAGRVDALLRAHDRESAADTRYGDAAQHVLDSMADGGLFDHLGGGFHRYCTDADWTVPHFEKMLYDQAALADLYVDGYRLFGDQRYADVVEETLAFVDRELGHSDGGFYATLDARSAPPENPEGVRGEAAGSSGRDERTEERPDGDHEEGAFYVWTPGDVREAVSDYADEASADESEGFLADLFCARYGVDAAGNFEDGQTVLTVSASLSELAEEFERSEAEVASALDAAEERLRVAREDRPRPARDEKVLAGWNGLMASAYAEAGLALDDAYAERAADAIEYVRETLWDGERLSRRVIDGDVAGVGYAEDYAYLAAGALATYEATGDRDHLGFALDLADALLAECYDAETGALYETPESVEDVGVRSQDVADGPTPSPVGVAAEALLALDAFDPDAGYGDAAGAMLERYGGRAETTPTSHATLALAADTHANGLLEVTVAADALPEEWRESVGGAYLPHRLLSVRPPTEAGVEAWLDDLELSSAPPIWAQRGAVDGEPAAYVCRRACSPPVTTTGEITEWLAEFRVTADAS